LIGLVIAPILGNGSHDASPKVVKMEMKMQCDADMMGKCDMSKCAEMTKEECAQMCDSLGCSPEEKEMCLSHYDADGKFVASAKIACCADKETAMPEMEKNVRVEIINTNGKAKATVTTTVNGTAATQSFEGTEAEVKAKVDALK
jgi:K(+)-stimulated pyrophosphate-energized sodium pump